VTALGVAIWQTLSRNKQLEEAQKAYNKSVVEARIEVAKVQDAFRQARMGLISKDEALKQYNSTIGQTVGEAKTLNEAEQLTAKNAGNYIKVQGLKAKANFLLAESAKISGEAEIARIELQNNPALAAASFGGFEGKIKEAEAKAAQLQNVVAGIENEIKTLSSGFAAPTGGGKATTVAGKIKEKEIEELDILGKFQAEQERARLQEFTDRYYNQEKPIIDQKKLDNIDFTGTIINNAKLVTTTEEEQSLARILIAEKEAEQKAAAAQQYANTLMVLSDLAGKETAAGKVLAIASATINTYLAASKALAGDYSGYGPAGPFVRVATVISTIALGLKQVKEIMKVSVPGGKGGGGSVNTAGLSGFQAGAPLQPQSPLASRTRLEQDQINQIGNATVRAFVVESDVTNNQERIRRLNRAARI